MSGAARHATAVAIGGAGVAIAGPPGSGKSDLALRLIDRGASLIADDRVIVTRRDAALWLSAPTTIAGRIEVRGIGIVTTAHCPLAPLLLWVEIGAPERLPEPRTIIVEEMAVAALTIAPFEASAPIKVELALKAVRTPLDLRSR